MIGSIDVAIYKYNNSIMLVIDEKTDVIKMQKKLQKDYENISAVPMPNENFFRWLN